MVELALLLAFAGLLVCLFDWRRGVLVVLLAGFFADPIRKLVPGQPVALTAVVAALALVCLLGAFRELGSRPVRYLLARYRQIGPPVQFFVVWVLLAAGLTMATYGSLILVGIGALAYLAPLPGLLLAFYFGSSPGAAARFFGVYLVTCLAMQTGIYLQWIGFDWEVLKQVGEQLYVSGVGISYSGFFRAGEVAAWHAGAAICLLVIFATSSSAGWRRWLAMAPIPPLLFVGLLTGRRKMFVQIVLFGVIYGLTLIYFRRGASRLVALGLAAALLGGMAVAPLLEEPARPGELGRYVGRGAQVVETAPERFEQLGLASVVWAIEQHGFLGGGLGIASQGGQHFGGGAALAGGAGEGGMGKIVTELGVPGLLLTLWLGLTVFRLLWRMLGGLSREAPELAYLICGLVALLASQIPTFVVASQIFGDPFVLTFLGAVLGLSLAACEWVAIRAPAADPRMGTPGSAPTPSRDAPPAGAGPPDPVPESSR